MNAIEAVNKKIGWMKPKITEEDGIFTVRVQSNVCFVADVMNFDKAMDDLGEGMLVSAVRILGAEAARGLISHLERAQQQ